MIWKFLNLSSLQFKLREFTRLVLEFDSCQYAAYLIKQRVRSLQVVQTSDFGEGSLLLLPHTSVPETCVLALEIKEQQ